ncbi:unnamed protein product [Clonostachys byssicola]|uniref:Zn(2)-C6 fungal-type domain-containing protein n=1 Tax=Clonostachys byssicola TaxID=160290 RepID=A0A9N9Y7J6_9HYPO|nr:unnamed protein product [Clonostachys byssicola]
MTKSTGERICRACIRCRQRKTKCDLDSVEEPGKPPCLSCHLDGYECALAGSKRGGDYSHMRRKSKNARNRSRQPPAPEPQPIQGIESHPPDPHQSQQPDLCTEHSTGVQNPLEALQILVQAAAASPSSTNKAINGSPAGQNTAHPLGVSPPDTLEHGRTAAGNAVRGLESYGPLANGLLDTTMLDHLLQHYAERYHPFMPIVPEHVLSPQKIQKTAAEEPFLLTSILTVSTKDRKGFEMLQRGLCSYIYKGIIDIVMGISTAPSVGSVEGLLLLAEWVPHADIGASSFKLPASGEDSAAWSLVGLAVRQAYLLHLDNYAFRTEIKDEPQALSDRKRLAWTFTYLSDRQISIRMGQAFWCRGPGSSARFAAEDYPTLRPKNLYDDDYASILIAQVDMTTLFGTVHDILYASKARTVALMLRGDYTKYLDDGLKGLEAWKDSWGRIKIPSHLRSLLDMQYEYLSLYVNAFGFHAVVCRALDQSRNSPRGAQGVSFFPHGVLACPDSRYIYSATEAASNLLHIISQRVDPVKHTRYLPARFYLYTIHSAVFLYRAHSLGALSEEAHQRSTKLVREFLTKLEAAASSEQHIASRYRKLVSSLWFQEETEPLEGFTRPRGSSHPSSRPSSALDRGSNTPFTNEFSLMTTTGSNAPLDPDSFSLENFGFGSNLAGPGFNEQPSFLNAGLALPRSYTFLGFPNTEPLPNHGSDDFGSLFSRGLYDV